MVDPNLNTLRAQRYCGESEYPVIIRPTNVWQPALLAQNRLVLAVVLVRAVFGPASAGVVYQCAEAQNNSSDSRILYNSVHHFLDCLQMLRVLRVAPESATDHPVKSALVE